MKKQEGLISVIVPVYRIERYVGLCIESIIKQTYANLEIILVDDGSPDRCPDICDLYAKKDRRIRVIHKMNGGLVSARKVGLEASNGEYIGYVDGDDWIAPDFYEELFRALESYNADVVVAGFVREFFEKTERFINAIQTGVYEGESLANLFCQFISCDAYYRPGIFTYVWNKLYRRKNIYANQMRVDNRISIGEDAICTYLTLLTCKRIYVSDNISYHYRQHEDSMLKKSEQYDKEVPKLAFLHEQLMLYTSGKANQYNLKQQIADYILSIFVIRSGGIWGLGNIKPSEFPFQTDIRGKRVAIYSAGTFGQQMNKRMQEYSYCTVVNWVDHDYWEYRRCGLDVNPVESLSDSDFDYVLIAAIDSVFANGIRNELATMGIPQSSILSICENRDTRNKALHRYLSLQKVEVERG